MRSVVALFTLVAFVVAVPARGAEERPRAELVMFESDGCAWCAMWHRELGEVYPNTDEGKLLPLRLVDIDFRPDDLENVQGIVFTPTFVVMEEGGEVGRIVGYPGHEFFWGLLDEIIGRMANRTKANF